MHEEWEVPRRSQRTQEGGGVRSPVWAELNGRGGLAELVTEFRI